MSDFHDCHGDGPCPVPPHPKLLARMKEDESLRKQLPQQVISRRRGVGIGAPTGTKFGLNDGTIFPKKRYHGVVSPARMSKAALERTPLRGALKVAIVLVEFRDRRMEAGKLEYFKDLFFSTGKIPTKSVTEYYTDVSGGKISLTGDVLGPFMMPKKLVQYANNHSGFSDEEPNIRTLAGDAFQAVRNQIDFSTLDNDKNGQVDAFIVVHAGPGAEVDASRDQIWSAKWNLIGNGQDVNGVNLSAFLTVPEDAKLGVCAHELGHLLFGWPDLYDIDSPDNEDGENIGIRSSGVGGWCLMSAGSWGQLPGTSEDEAGTTPCHPSAWCKANQGWVTVLNETNNRSVTLKDVKAAPREVHRLWTNGDVTSKEYFLIENRQQTGFDRSLPGPGLLVWHIDDNQTNNRDENHQWVGLKEADGLRQLETGNVYGDAGDPFPGTANKTSFGPFTNPDSNSYQGHASNVSITNISRSGATMTMKVAVRVPGPRL